MHVPVKVLVYRVEVTVLSAIAAIVRRHSLDGAYRAALRKLYVCAIVGSFDVAGRENERLADSSWKRSY